MRHRPAKRASAAAPANIPRVAPAAPGDTGAARGSFQHFPPISDEIFHAGIYVVGAGRRVVHSGQTSSQGIHPPLYQFKWEEGRILPDFAFLLVEAGKGVFESRATGRVELAAGMAVMMFPGIWHRFRPAQSHGWTVSWMSFNGEFAHRLLDQKIISPARTVIRTADLRATQDALGKVLERVHANPASNSLQLSLEAIGVLATLGEAPAGMSQPGTARNEAPEDPIVATALGYIWTSSHHVLSVKDVADATGVTRRTLERHIAESREGSSVLDEIIRCRFDRAARLLRETDLPPKTVVALAGFGSLANMRRVFASRTSLSLLQYRRRHGVRTAPAQSR